ncbi:MAG: hypothetical protein AB1611_11015 [bacterium]
MNRGKLFKKNVFLAGIMLFLVLALVPGAGAQFGPFGPYFNPLAGIGPFGFVPFAPPALSSFGIGPYRTAHAPLTTATLFPAPVVPTAPAVTAVGVGVTTLVPTVPVTATVPASVLVTTPLAPLITFTPLSLVGLTFAPVPTAPATVAIPVTAITTAPTIIPTTPTATAVGLASLISSLLI